MFDVYTYLVDLPTTIAEMVTPSDDSFTIYLNSKLSYQRRVEAYLHALRHIENGDFDYDNIKTVAEMERIAHGPRN